MKKTSIQYASAVVMGAALSIAPLTAQEATKVPEKKGDVTQPGKVKLPKPVKIAM